MINNVGFDDELWEVFTDEMRETMEFIQGHLAYDHPALSLNENYFMLAVFEKKDTLAYKIIEALISSTAFDIVHDGYYKMVNKAQLLAIKPNRKIPFDPKFIQLMHEAKEEMERMGDRKLATIHVILALINPDKDHVSTRNIMKRAGINYHLLMGRLTSLKNDENPNPEPEKNNEEPPLKPGFRRLTQEELDTLISGGSLMLKPVNGQYLSSYTVNLNQMAKDGKIDPVIGRDKEIDRIVKIFNRRKKNNVIVIGDKGSGKTAICESLAWLIVNNQAPYTLKDKTILKLDVASMIAGTQYRGMFEERAKGVFQELKKNPNCILFVDDFHSHTAKKDIDSATDITPYMKEAIGDGSIKVIVTSTPKGYHRKFDADQSFANKFQRIDLTPLSDEQIKEVLMFIKPTYESFHAVEISEEIIDLCITLCKKYITDREMPDSVIDLIDEIGACVSRKYKESPEVSELKEELLALSESKKNAVQNENFDEVDSISEKEAKKMNTLKKKEKNPKIETIIITKEMVFETISEKTGVPIQNLSEEGKKNLSDINKRIKEVVIGQDEAVDEICKAIKRKKLGLHNNRGSAYFCKGPTGCGKTLLAKKLAEQLFGSEKALVRFDMSEYADKTAVNKLIGSNAGYVGYEEGGLLTETIKNKKHCILLLDEIEKAHDDIFNIFLQVFDEGFLTDNTGQKVDFRNVIIILTSNVGARAVNEAGKGIGFHTNDAARADAILDKELKKRFSPEFLNRLDGIINFNPLNEENLKKIIVLEIEKSVKRFKDIGYTVTYDNTSIDHIYEKIKDDLDYGARPIIRAIQDEIEAPLTDAILDGLCDDVVKILFEDNNVIIECGEK